MFQLPRPVPSNTDTMLRQPLPQAVGAIQLPSIATLISSIPGYNENAPPSFPTLPARSPAQYQPAQYQPPQMSAPQLPSLQLPSLQLPSLQQPSHQIHREFPYQKDYQYILPHQAPQPTLGAQADLPEAPEMVKLVKEKRKYVCKVCSRPFTTSGHLARHHRIHTGEKKHVCPFDGCGARFARHDNCIQHYRTHFKQKGSRANSRS